MVDTARGETLQINVSPRFYHLCHYTPYHSIRRPWSSRITQYVLRDKGMFSSFMLKRKRSSLILCLQIFFLKSKTNADRKEVLWCKIAKQNGMLLNARCAMDVLVVGYHISSIGVLCRQFRCDGHQRRATSWCCMFQTSPATSMGLQRCVCRLFRLLVTFLSFLLCFWSSFIWFLSGVVFRHSQLESLY